MSTNKRVIDIWFEEGIKRETDYMLIVCDNFDHEDYPVYCYEHEYEKVYNKYDNKNMQKIMESYNLHKNKEKQLNINRVFEKPEKKVFKEKEEDHFDILL